MHGARMVQASSLATPQRGRGGECRARRESKPAGPQTPVGVGSTLNFSQKVTHVNRVLSSSAERENQFVRPADRPFTSRPGRQPPYETRPLSPLAITHSFQLSVDITETDHSCV